MSTVATKRGWLLPFLGDRAAASTARPSFEAVYAEHFEFVRRSLQRMGLPEAGVDDALQDVFVVVHRRLPSFDHASLRGWLFGIALNVAREHRRRLARKGHHEELSETLRDPTANPHEAAERSEALTLLDHLLDALTEDRRAVFILIEYEGMSAPEVAAALDVNVNTVSSRLRAARRDFEAALQRHRARSR